MCFRSNKEPCLYDMVTEFKFSNWKQTLKKDGRKSILVYPSSCIYAFPIS